MLETIALFGVLPALVCFGLGVLSKRPWVVMSVMMLVAMPLAFWSSPLGPIGPAMFALVVAGVAIGAAAARVFRSAHQPE